LISATLKEDKSTILSILSVYHGLKDMTDEVRPTICKIDYRLLT